MRTVSHPRANPGKARLRARTAKCNWSRSTRTKIPRSRARCRSKAFPPSSLSSADSWSTKFVGALPEEQVEAFYNSLIPSEADIKAAEGYRMMQENQIPIARLHFEAALEENPDHEPAGVGLAAILARLGETDRAAELAQRWPKPIR